MAGKRFLLVTWDGGGNLPPELAVCRKLIERGHAVRVLGDPTIEPEVRAAGCEFSPWTTAPHRTTRDRSGDLIRDYEWKNPMVMIKKYMGEFLAGPTPRWAADVHGELTARPVDAVLADFAIPAALLVAEQLGLPSASIHPQIWMVPTKGIPPLGPGFMPARGPLGRLRDALLRRITTRLFNTAVPALNAERKARGLEPIESTHQQMLRADRILMLTSPVFDFTAPAMPRHLAWVGPQLDDPSWTETWTSPWPAGDERPLVLVGLSSTFQDQVTALRRIVEALGTLPVRALVTRGPALRPEEVPGTANVSVVATAPHGVVLPEASLMITHCGHGTTMKGLAAGVPLVCIPMGRDQNDTAARVVHRGAGVRLKPTAGVAAIRGAVERVLQDPNYRAGAQRLAAAIRNGEGCVDPVAELEAIIRADRAAA